MEIGDRAAVWLLLVGGIQAGAVLQDLVQIFNGQLPIRFFLFDQLSNISRYYAAQEVQPHRTNSDNRPR